MIKQSLQKRGSLIVAALVVLFLVVLMSTQTIQTLMLVRRGDSRQNTLRQARELLELGRIMRRQHLQATQFESATLILGDNRQGLISIELQDATKSSSDSDAREEVTDETVQDESTTLAEQAAAKQCRIIAMFPAGTDSEVTATWEGIE